MDERVANLREETIRTRHAKSCEGAKRACETGDMDLAFATYSTWGRRTYTHLHEARAGGHIPYGFAIPGSDPTSSSDLSCHRLNALTLWGHARRRRRGFGLTFRKG